MERVRNMILQLFAVLLYLANTAYSQGCNNTDIRLVGGRNNLEGRVEVCFRGQWGTVCDDFWDANDAIVACRQLGLTSEYAIALRGANNRIISGPGIGLIFLDNVECQGDETHLDDCTHNEVGVHNCDHNEDAGVICSQQGCNNTDIRLVGGRNNFEGRVEVCFRGQWGTVCDDFWDDNDASVACRQLGLNSEFAGEINVDSSNFGFGVGPIFLDNVECRGDETNLDDCTHSAVGVHNCDHSEDAGVICPQDGVCNNTNIRLVGGRNNFEGRVEVCFRGQWGTVCDDFWDTRDASVACRKLGLNTEYAIALKGANNNIISGPGTGPIFLDNVQCQGDETNLDDCTHRGVGIHNCDHSRDAGVICSQQGCNNTDIRLVGGRNNLEGRVEVCFRGQWGTVCDDFWNDNDASVACRQLGLSTEFAIALKGANNRIIFGSGTGLIFLDNVECQGDETNLDDCTHRGVGVHNCDHNEDAGVICSQQGCNNTDIRLVGGRNNLEGRVEVCFRGQWGTVCDDFWDDNDASVACRQLGFSTEFAIALKGANNEIISGPGTGLIFFDNVECQGNETNLDHCTHRGVGVHNCDHSEDAGVICSQQGCNNTDIQLVGGRNNFEGRVEVCFRGQWGTVCDALWDDNDAIVACRQLGLTSEYAVAINAEMIFGSGIGPIFLNNVSCGGDETSLDDCIHSAVGVHNCDHSEDAGVICSQQECVAGTVRLVDGISESNGRVEFCNMGIWGTVCDDSWDNNDAAVVCRQLGYSTAGATATRLAHFGPGAGYIVLDNVNCNGIETNLTQCGHRGFGVHNCAPSEDAGAFCSTGRVERCTLDVETARLNVSQTRMVIQQFGTCEQYEQASELCDAYFNETDYVYIPNTRTQSEITATLRRIPTANISATAECQDNVLRIICHNFYVPCGRNGIPTSICQEECSYVRDTCQTFWDQAFQAIESELDRINCESPGSALSLLPSCCTGAGISILLTTMPTTSTSEATSSQVSAPIIGGSIGGALILIIMLLVLVVIIAAVVMRGKRAAVQNLQIDVIANDSTNTEELTDTQPYSEFGIVYKAQLAGMEMHSIKTVAVKTLKGLGLFDQNEIDKIMEESMKMKQFNHPNVMNLIGVCINAGPAPYIVMPFMANGSLLSYLRKERSNILLNENTDEDLVLEVKKRLTVVCSQIASGMEYLTQENFIHRDLATRNCMLDAHFVIKIADFGLSEDVYARNYFRQGQGPAVKLPVKWMALESLQDGVFSEKTDVWSFGVTCWEIFSGGKTPYPGVDPLSLVQLLEDGHRLSKPANSACPEEMYSIMLKCWNSDPSERPSFSALVKSISGFAEMTAGYLDVSNYNPFEPNISTTTTSGENCEQTEEK